MLLRLIHLFFVTTSLTFAQPARHWQRNKARPTYRSSSKTKSPEVVRLAEALHAHGASVLFTKEKVSQPFFSMAGRIININGEAVQVVDYGTSSAAEANARRVSADGTTIGTSKPSWMAPPHFFKRRKLIVLYVGRNQTIVDLLRKVLGNQFAGG